MFTFLKKSNPRLLRKTAEQTRLADAAEQTAKARNASANPLLARHAVALVSVVPAAASDICFPDARFANVWVDSERYIDDVAAFLAFILITHARADERSRSNTDTIALLALGAEMFETSGRALGLIERYNSLMHDPGELKARRILSAYPTMSDTRARYIVFPMMINEAVGGPPLDGDDEVGFFLHSWLRNIQAAANDSYGSAVN